MSEGKCRNYLFVVEVFFIDGKVIKYNHIVTNRPFNAKLIGSVQQEIRLMIEKDERMGFYGEPLSICVTKHDQLESPPVGIFGR